MSDILNGKIKNSYIHSRAKKIFHDEAADPTSNYKSSWVPRRRLFPPLRVKEEEVPIASAAMRGSIKYGYNEIGYYEKTFLRNLKSASNLLHTFRSGSGSGKSSFCKTLDYYINSSYENVLKLEVDGSDSESGLKKSIYVNVNPEETPTGESSRQRYRDELEITGVYRYPDKKSNYTKFVKSQIINEIENFFNSDLSQQQFLKAHFSQRLNDKRVSAGTARRIRLIYNQCSRGSEVYDFCDKFWIALERDESVSVSDLLTIIGLISSERSANHETVLSEGGESELSDEFLFRNYPFCIFLDNADQFVEVDLKSLYNDLRTFERKRLNSFPNLRIILPLRLASYSELMGTQIDSDPDYFGSAKPVDIILDRIFDEIFSKDFDLSSYSSDQTKYLSRLFELICVITDHKCDFSKLLFAIAGSNIRLAFKLTHDWLTSEAIKPRINTFAEVISSRNALARILANDYTDNYVSCIFDLIDEGVKSCESAHTTAENIKSFCLNEIRETSAQYENNPVSHGFRVSRIIEVITKKTSQKIPTDLSIEVVVLKHFKALLRMGVDRDWLSNLQEEIDKIIDEEMPSSIHISDVKTYHFALLKCIGDIKAKKPESKNVKKHLKKHSNDIDLEINDALSRKNRQSRFHLSSVLLLQSEMRKGTEEQDFSPVNLFTINGDDVNVFPLWLVYSLRERLWNDQKGMNFKRILKISNRLGNSRADTLDLLKNLTRPDRRLIFSSVDDYHQLRDNGSVALQRDFLLSWAGHGYLDTMLGSTCYSQWAFSSIDSLIGLTGMSRREYFKTYYAILDKDDDISPSPLLMIFTGIIRSIGHLFSSESDILKVLEKSNMNEATFRCGSPVSDLFFRQAGIISRIISVSEGLHNKENYDDLKSEIRSVYSLISACDYKTSSNYNSKIRSDVNAINKILE